jgi:hypothetical protein
MDHGSDVAIVRSRELRSVAQVGFMRLVAVGWNGAREVDAESHKLTHLFDLPLKLPADGVV